MRDLAQLPVDLRNGGEITSVANGGDKLRCARILGVAVDAVDIQGSLAIINAHLTSGRKGFVCAVGVHGILEALRIPELAETYAQSILNTPDGAPTVWIGRLQGFRQMDHVTGPALMKEIFSRREFASRSHFFYGGKPGVAAELASSMLCQFPWIRIAGSYTPPFRNLTEDEEREVAAHINSLHPDFIWVGISTPRQELWMRHMLPRMNAGLMSGVGAAFDFHTGRIRECPLWIKRAGFNWLHRLMQDPRRLWRRNLHNMLFLWYFAFQLTGLRRYPLPRSINRAGSPCEGRADQTYSDAPQAPAARWLRRW
ncbi:MAG TPA: WecB/TagA/CpsF family glycosyltransferase [Terracidiphilus sp.]|jgi:N-acetylglucosaminyldiphosphoundecaprenol N-acetyl-beta-D-mannosaminyltransferase